MKFKILSISLLIIILSFPSICFSELKTVEGEYCDVYLGDMKNKKELKKVRETTRTLSIKNGLEKIVKDKKFESINYVKKIQQSYIENIKVISHSEKGRKICDKIQVTVDLEILKSILKKDVLEFDDGEVVIGEWEDVYYCKDILKTLDKEREKIVVGVLTEIKETGISIEKKNKWLNKIEEQVFMCISKLGEKVTLVDRIHLDKIIDEQKLSLSGITDTNILKVGKILNLQILIFVTIYEETLSVKLLKVDTGEILHFGTYGLQSGRIFKGIK